jgi:hypothetical protein
MDYSTIILSYVDLLDILDEYRVNNWKSQPCNVEAYAKYVWEQYREEINPLEEIE